MTQKKQTTATQKKQTTAKGGKKTASTETIKGLQSQRQQIQKNIKQQKQKLAANRRDVKRRLQNLMMINTEIEDRQHSIDTIQHGISLLDKQIASLSSQRDSLLRQLDKRKELYLKSLMYMHSNRSLQNRIMFILSANNFTQMYRRLRFVRQYASYQRTQGEAVKLKKDEVDEKYRQLTNRKREKIKMLQKGQREHKALQEQEEKQQDVVKSLKKEQKNIQSLITQQQKKDGQLNAQIDRMIAEEAAKAEARAKAEAQKKAAEEKARREAERKAEVARKQAEAKKAAEENARRVALAKEKERKAKEEAKKAAKNNTPEKEATEKKALQAQQEREAEERHAAEDAKRYEKAIAEAEKTPKAEKNKWTVSSEDRRLSGSFENNKGRLPMPVTGEYKIINRFGSYAVEGLNNVRLDNKGINIKARPGASVRNIYDGEVSGVFNISGTFVVMIRHGLYISVYSGLNRVSIKKGQKVSTRQVIGTLGNDDVLQFQLRKLTQKLNPEQWLGR